MLKVSSEFPWGGASVYPKMFESNVVINVG